MTHRNRIRLSKLSIGLIAALAAAPVFAQSTSAGVGGLVTDSTGQPVAGAEVVITHVESGTVSRATTDASGRYNARGLRVGGPYEITITKSGQGTKTEDNVFLALNQVNNVNAALTGDVTTLGTVTAVGVAGGLDLFSSTKMGTGTNVDRSTIEALPSIGGNIQDYMRLDPRVTFINRAEGSISAGGQNPRYNSISIDGVSASDTFGLEGNNMTTRRQPVAMEAIEAIDINLSNYDVTIAGASGANINAVTKSGTNEFSGSVYGTYRDGDWFGDNPDGVPFNGFTSEETWGATFGGPLIKDRLFFFANYEKFKQAAPGHDLSTTALGRPQPVIDMGDIERAQQIAEGYGFNAGGLGSNADTNLEEYALKLDWNINDNHRASLRYSKLVQDKLRIQGMGSSSVSLSSYWYTHEKSVESYVGQLFSDWTDTFSTEFKLSFRDYKALRVTDSTAPSIRIFFEGNEAAPTGDSIYLGTELNTHGNELMTETWDFYGAGTLTLGDHDLKFGVSYSDNDIYNYYGANSWGTYTFYGLDNFAAGRWSTYNLSAETSPNSIPAVYANRNLGLFVQDTWYVNPNLTLTLGLRADKPSVSPSPAYNREASEYFGYDNSEVFDGGFLLQPRLGFNYTFDSELPSQLRGGVGLFQGDAPQVWVGNSFNTTGFNYVSYNYTAFDPTVPFNPDGLNQTPPAGPGVLPTQNVNFVDRDFALPSVWKANLAYDHELPWYGIVASAEAMFTRVNDGLYYNSLNIGDVPVPGRGPVPNYIGPDGRDMYFNPAASGRAWTGSDARYGRDPRFNNVYLIRNTGGGRTEQFTFSLAKPWSVDGNWSWNLGYTYTHATEVGPLTSSTASSGYNYQYAFNTNEDLTTRSRYEIRDRFSASLNWKHAFFGDYETRVGLVYEGRSGRPFSYVFVNDANGDSRAGNDLFYVPAGRGDVLFGNLSSAGVFTPDAAMENAFFEWLESNQELARYAGSTAPANGFRADWVNTFDLRFSQELPGFMSGHKSELWLDIQNVGNLINSDWGHIYDYGFFANSRVATVQGIYDGRYVYNYRFADAPAVANGDADGFDQGVSQWSVQLGFRYKF
ncbi:TonB-dependent receptor [Luteimonas composti]|uniref:TonB-dependent receptor n=1 Tax=Luteimonas composti TaxID=398257 RepID=A0ABT6MUA2_9GAMM|nr:TonB-dependent receptor [Luteimonas composti]MDH7454163.1 TonB-dependent receptor [Luteimonas composti]